MRRALPRHCSHQLTRLPPTPQYHDVVFTQSGLRFQQVPNNVLLRLPVVGDLVMHAKTGYLGVVKSFNFSVRVREMQVPFGESVPAKRNDPYNQEMFETEGDWMGKWKSDTESNIMTRWGGTPWAGDTGEFSEEVAFNFAEDEFECPQIIGVSQVPQVTVWWTMAGGRVGEREMPPTLLRFDQVVLVEGVGETSSVRSVCQMARWDTKKMPLSQVAKSARLRSTAPAAMRVLQTRALPVFDRVRRTQPDMAETVMIEESRTLCKVMWADGTVEASVPSTALMRAGAVVGSVSLMPGYVLFSTLYCFCVATDISLPILRLMYSSLPPIASVLLLTSVSRFSVFSLSLSVAFQRLRVARG